METKFCILTFHLLLAFASCADLPTLYEYYTADGITSGLSVDQPYFTLNGKNITIYSGEMHYFRIPPQYWRDRLRKLRAAGLNTVATYVPWNLHEPRNGSFDFGNGGSDMEMFLDLEGYLAAAQEEDLLVVVRGGPYICAEWEWGGFPSWLLREESVQVRTFEETYLGYVERYFTKLISVLAKYQFTNGGPVIAFQVENEYGNSPYNKGKEYLQRLYDITKDKGIVELLVTADSPKRGTTGTLPGVLFMTANFGADPDTAFGLLEEMQPGQPLMAMEFYSGWFDHWSETHHTTSAGTFRKTYESILAYPGSVNLYMFHGGTNWGFLNGATIGPGDNSALQPTTSSYDYNAPLTEAGDYTSKYDTIRELTLQYNPIQTLTPDPPTLVERQVYANLPIEGQLSFNDILEKSSKISTNTLSMEQLPINDDSGQSYGYTVYRQEGLNIPADSSLTITGHVHDTVMILIDGVLISDPLSSSDDFNNFGYWRLENSIITLTSTDLEGVTLDLVIENWGRGNSGRMYHQVKGLVEDNHVYLNDQELTSWEIYPLEFKKSWTNGLSGWNSVRSEDLPKGPGLYKTTLTVGEDYTDTFLDMTQWNKGIVIVNGFVLGRYAFIGPQQSLYLPGPLLQPGDNEIIIFEHFEPATEVKFSKDTIFNNP